MVDYFEATLIDPRTLREANFENKIEERVKNKHASIAEDKDVPTITINGKVESLNDVSQSRTRTRSSVKSSMAKTSSTRSNVARTSETKANVKKASASKVSTSKGGTLKASISKPRTMNESHRDRKPKVVKAAMVTDFSQPLVEEIKWDSKKLEAKQVNVRHRTRNIVLTTIIAFVVCLGIVYQYSLVNASFMEKKKLESRLSEVLKQNEQLEVKIEGATNMKTIEQEAKEQLGMQKVDNQQKVYVDLDKSDFIKPSNDN